MRALNITQTLLDKVNRQAHATQSKHATMVHLALGEISELDPASLQTHWNELSKGTPAEHAQLRFRLIPAEVQCMACIEAIIPSFANRGISIVSICWACSIRHRIAGLLPAADIKSRTSRLARSPIACTQSCILCLMANFAKAETSVSGVVICPDVLGLSE